MKRSEILISVALVAIAGLACKKFGADRRAPGGADAAPEGNAPELPAPLCPAPSSIWGGGAYATCLKDDANRCTMLGIAHQSGVNGVPKSEACATALFKRACDGNDRQGCQMLGNAYAYGLGVKRDDGEAARSFEKACALGEPLSCEAAKGLKR
jgi:TPR repeat protein